LNPVPTAGSSRTDASFSKRRIDKDIEDLGSGGPDFIKVEPVHGQEFHFKGTIQGPSQTPYEGGTFVVHIAFPNEYTAPHFITTCRL
jgi:ubiquitin-conjugating enzyme E2 D/E